jgi:hypothetical protein
MWSLALMAARECDSETPCSQPFDPPAQFRSKGGTKRKPRPIRPLQELRNLLELSSMLFGSGLLFGETLGFHEGLL